MTAPDPLEVWDWSESEWCRQNGVRRHPRGVSYHAETRGGTAPPVAVALYAAPGGWRLQVAKEPRGTYTELRAALRALLAATTIDANALR